MVKWECYRGCTWEAPEEVEEYKECPNCGAPDTNKQE